MIEGVVIAGDLLRPHGSGRPGGTDRATRWLWSAVKRSVYLATGLATEMLTATSTPAFCQWIESLRAPAEADAYWASIHAQLPWGAAPPYTQVTATDGMRLPPKPNRLRIALDSFWNYQQIDADRTPPPTP
jgi:hypothetical protein